MTTLWKLLINDYECAGLTYFIITDENLTPTKYKGDEINISVPDKLTGIVLSPSDELTKVSDITEQNADTLFRLVGDVVDDQRKRV